MKIRIQTITAATALLLQCAPLLAGASPKPQPQLAGGVDLIVTALNSGAAVPDMMKQIIVGLRSKYGVCKTNYLRDQSQVAECIRGNAENGYQGKIEDYLNAGVASGKLDVVESAVLARLFTAVTSVKGNDVAGIQVAEVPAMAAATGKGISQPSITTYRQNKAAYSALRVAKKMEAVLPSDLVAQMEKSFPRKMNGVGTITAEQYFAAQLGRLQLNELSGLMISATDFMTRPEAKIVFYPATYNSNKQQIQQIQTQEVALAQQIVATDDDTTREQLRAQLQALDTQISSYRQKDQIDTLTSQREKYQEDLTTAIATLAATDITDDDQRTQLGDAIKTAIAGTSDVDTQLASLIRTKDVDPEDVQRFAINALKQDLETLKQDAPFSQMPNLDVGDVLLAAWVSGDVSSDALRALSQIDGMKEAHESAWKKALDIGWTIGKDSLMAFPTTSYYAIGISIFLQIRQQASGQKKEQADETHLIPAQN